MWTDISQFDISDHQKMTAFGSSKAGKFTDIGEVCVVNSISGKAKVRVMHPRKKRSLFWPLATLAVTGIAVAVWLEQDKPKPPEPMRIIVRSVSSEGTVETSSQTLQAAPTIINNKPQPALPLVNRESAKTVQAAKPPIPIKPQATPLAASNGQPKNPAVVQQAAKLPVPIQPPAQPVAKPVAAQAAAPVINDEKPAITMVAEPLPENNTKSMAPASSDPPSDQTITQPN